MPKKSPVFGSVSGLLIHILLKNQYSGPKTSPFFGIDFRADFNSYVLDAHDLVSSEFDIKHLGPTGVSRP